MASRFTRPCNLLSVEGASKRPPLLLLEQEGYMTIASEAMPAPSVAARAREARVQRFASTDAFFRMLTRAAAILVLLILGGVAISLVVGSWPALSTFGAAFLVTESWNPVTEKFGALAPIYGTVVT